MAASAQGPVVRAAGLVRACRTVTERRYDSLRAALMVSASLNTVLFGVVLYLVLK